MLMRIRFHLFLAFVVASSLPLAPAMAGDGVFNPQTFTLKNGMRVVVVPNHRVPVVTHMVWYKAGSADEAPGRTGAAHLLEHLMFKGTKSLPSGEFSKIVARNGGTENAFTSLDYTGYFQTVATGRLETMMTMEADRMTGLVFDQKEVDTERLVVLEERRQRTDNNPGAILREHVNAATYLNYPYGRPIIGWEHEIRALKIDDLKNFYGRWYRPGNAILVVAGDMTAEKLRPMAERTYGKIPAVSAVFRDRPSEPAHSASRRVELRDARVSQPTWSRAYMAPSQVTGISDGAGTEHAIALEVLAEIIGHGSSSPLYRSLVIDQKLAVTAAVSYSADSLGPARFIFYALPRTGVSLGQIETAMEAEIAKTLKTGVDADQLARAKTRLKAEAVYARDSLSTGARVLGAALASGQTIEDVENWVHRIDAVTVEAVNKAAKIVFEGRPSVTAVLLGEDTQ